MTGTVQSLEQPSCGICRRKVSRTGTASHIKKEEKYGSKDQKTET